jgi:hypothetical protein
MISAKRAFPHVITSIVSLVVGALITFITLGNFGAEDYRVRYYAELVRTLSSLNEKSDLVQARKTLSTLREGLRRDKVTSKELREEVPESVPEGDQWLREFNAKIDRLSKQANQ